VGEERRGAMTILDQTTRAMAEHRKSESQMGEPTREMTGE
jgi:hypothetical protein